MNALPDHVPGYGAVAAFVDGAACPDLPVMPARAQAGMADKRRPSLAAALAAAGLRDGMTISFHHHLRNGDGVLNAVLEAVAQAGIGDLTLAPSSIFASHAPLLDHIAQGRVTGLRTAYVAGPVAQAISRGALARPVVLHTHGGRARDIETGRFQIDVAFIAASMADAAGNLTGARGPSAFGPLGYGQVDAARARVTVAVTDCLVDRLPCPADIPGTQVDHLVVLDRIGDAARMVSGSVVPSLKPWLVAGRFELGFNGNTAYPMPASFRAASSTAPGSIVPGMLAPANGVGVCAHVPSVIGAVTHAHGCGANLAVLRCAREAMVGDVRGEARGEQDVRRCAGGEVLVAVYCEN